MYGIRQKVDSANKILTKNFTSKADLLKIQKNAFAKRQNNNNSILKKQQDFVISAYTAKLKPLKCGGILNSFRRMTSSESNIKMFHFKYGEIEENSQNCKNANGFYDVIAVSIGYRHF